MPDTRLLWRAIKKTSSCYKSLLFVVILIVLLESPKFAGDSAGCHCHGRVLRSIKQHGLYEAAAYTHVTMGFRTNLVRTDLGPCRGKLAPMTRRAWGNALER